jgi:hypothetical protein
MTDRTDEPRQEADLWTWIVIGVAFCAVTAALYGPLVWQMTRG